MSFVEEYSISTYCLEAKLVYNVGSLRFLDFGKAFYTMRYDTISYTVFDGVVYRIWYF